MQATLALFPGGKKTITIPTEGNTATLGAILAAAEQRFTPNDGIDYAVNDVPTTDENMEVPDGAVVRASARVANG